MAIIKYVLVSMIMYCGCSSVPGTDIDTMTDPTDTTKIDTMIVIKDTMSNRNVKYLALGDSYTIGESVSFSERFPIQLSKIKFDGVANINVKIIATTGWTTTNLLDAIARDNVEKDTFDFITLLIGVNNQYQNKPFSIYETEFVTLIDKSIAMVGNDAKKVIVVSIPNYGVTPFAANRNPAKIGEEIKKYNDYAQQVAKNRGSRFVNITDISELAANDQSLLAQDKLHPSGSMYKMWADLIAQDLKMILK